MDSKAVPSPSLSISKPLVIEECPEAEFNRLMNYCESKEEICSQILDQAWDLMSSCGFPNDFLNQFGEQLKKASKKHRHYSIKSAAS